MKIATLVALAQLAVTGMAGNALADAPKLPPPDSGQPPKSAFIFAENFHFFYISRDDKRFHNLPRDGALAIGSPKAAEPDYAETYLAARAGKPSAAKAKTPFLLMGRLPSGGYPSPFSYRVAESSIEDYEIDCKLQFTYHSIPNAGPGIPHVAYFVAEMPALPKGDYVIRFQVVKSYFDRGDGLMRLDPGRASLEDTPYQAEFSIND